VEDKGGDSAWPIDTSPPDWATYDTSGDSAGETDTTWDTGVVFQMTGDVTGEGLSGDCADGICIYRITTSREAGDLELDMTETADPTGLYNENHTGFAFERENGDGSFTYRLDLTWVTDMADVVVNETTLFNPDVRPDIFNRTTWYFGATSRDGTVSDCRVTGQDPGYYAAWCTNVI
jgi:hypothetical protein